MARSLVRIGSLLVLWQIASCEKTETAEVEANQSGQYNGEKNKKISQAEITQVGALDAAELNEDEEDEVEDAEKYAVEVTSHGDLGKEETEELTRVDRTRICCRTERKDSEHDTFFLNECMERHFCNKKFLLEEVVDAKETNMADCAKAKEEGGYGQDCQTEYHTKQLPKKTKSNRWGNKEATVRICCGMRGFHVWRSGPKCTAWQFCNDKGYSSDNPVVDKKVNTVVQVDGSKCDWECESR